MLKQTLAQLAADCGGTVCGDGDIVVTGVSTDSRDIAPGNLFIALVGERFDGHDHADASLGDGAVAALVSRAIEGPHILVDDTLVAMGDLAAAQRQRFDGTVIAVTGSSGKTTVKEWCAHTLAAFGTTDKNFLNFNNLIGLPRTILNADESAAYWVLEAGTNQPGEIPRLGTIANPDIAIITNVGWSHAENFDSDDALVSEKTALSRTARQGGLTIIPGDVQNAPAIASMCQGTVASVGRGEACDFQGAGSRILPNGCARFTWQGHGITLPVPGDHQVRNALSVLAVGEYLGLNAQALVESMCSFGGATMRFDVTDVGDITVINDAYNSNPISAIAALDTLGSMETKGRKVAVLGTMLELGEKAEQGHRDVLERALADDIDAVYVVGEYFSDLGLSHPKLKSFAHKDDLQTALVANFHPHDTVLFKASRGVALETIITFIKDNRG